MRWYIRELEMTVFLGPMKRTRRFEDLIQWLTQTNRTSDSGFLLRAGRSHSEFAQAVKAEAGRSNQGLRTDRRRVLGE